MTSSSSNHRLEALAPESRSRYACQHCRSKGGQRPRAVAAYSYECNASARTMRRQQRTGHVCLDHAYGFARKHGLELPGELAAMLEPSDRQALEALEEELEQAKARRYTVTDWRRARALELALATFREMLDAGASVAGGPVVHEVTP